MRKWRRENLALGILTNGIRVLINGGIFQLLYNLFWGCLAAKFQIQMESFESKLQSDSKQAQCQPPKEFKQTGSIQYIPPDDYLAYILTTFPSFPPFIIHNELDPLAETPPKKKICFKIHEKILNYNRKERSLEELSKKFLQKFQGQNQKYLELDKITKELGVQRRRIYDIINILESLRVVVKKGKNNYRWRGLNEAVKTIKGCEKDPDYVQIEKLKKQKSLEYLANSFLKLLLKKPAISLEEAAKQIISEGNEQLLRTKIRRLYDIINVFKSLGLVKKIALPSKKPGFKWLGTDNLLHYIRQKNPSQQTSVSKQVQQFGAFQETSSFLMDILQKRIGLEDLENLSELFGRKIFPGYVEMSRSYEEDEIENDILKVNEQSFRRRLGHAPI